MLLPMLTAAATSVVVVVVVTGLMVAVMGLSGTSRCVHLCASAMVHFFGSRVPGFSVLGSRLLRVCASATRRAGSEEPDELLR